MSEYITDIQAEKDGYHICLLKWNQKSEKYEPVDTAGPFKSRDHAEMVADEMLADLE